MSSQLYLVLQQFKGILAHLFISCNRKTNILLIWHWTSTLKSFFKVYMYTQFIKWYVFIWFISSNFSNSIILIKFLKSVNFHIVLIEHCSLHADLCVCCMWLTEANTSAVVYDFLLNQMQVLLKELLGINNDMIKQHITWTSTDYFYSAHFLTNYCFIFTQYQCFEFIYVSDVLCFSPAVCSSVRTEDVSYGQIIIKNKKARSRTRGTAALVCLMSAVCFTQ